MVGGTCAITLTAYILRLEFEGERMYRFDAAEESFRFIAELADETVRTL